MLNNLLDGQNLKRGKMGGGRTAAEIINLMKTQQEEAVITAVRGIRRASWRRKLSTRCSCSKTVEVDDRSIQRLLQKWTPSRCLSPSKVPNSPLREVPAQHVPACSRYPARRPCQPWPGASVSGGNEQKAILLIVRRLAETGEMVIGSGRYLCLMSCRGSAGRLTIWPLPSEFTPAVVASPEEGDTDVEAPELSEEEQRTQMLAQLQMQAHEQV